MKQRDIERYYFEKFQRAYLLPPGEITYADRPDVRIAGAKKIGIEITNFYLMSGTSSASEQVQSKLRRTAVAEGQRLFTNSGGQNVELTFSFDKTQPIQDVRDLARKLADLGKRVERGVNGPIRKDVYKDIPELDFVYLYARELQHDNVPDPKFPDGAPDLSKGFTVWADYRNRREARALQAGIYNPLPFSARWKVGQHHSPGLMSIKRLNEDHFREGSKGAAVCTLRHRLVINRHRFHRIRTGAGNTDRRTHRFVRHVPEDHHLQNGL